MICISESTDLDLKSNHLYLLLEICPGWHSIEEGIFPQVLQIRKMPGFVENTVKKQKILLNLS